MSNEMIKKTPTVSPGDGLQLRIPKSVHLTDSPSCSPLQTLLSPHLLLQNTNTPCEIYDIHIYHLFTEHFPYCFFFIFSAFLSHLTVVF